MWTPLTIQEKKKLTIYGGSDDNITGRLEKMQQHLKNLPRSAEVAK